MIGLARKIAAIEAALTVNQKLQADAILNTLNEEADNLRPLFNHHERTLIRFAIGIYHGIFMGELKDDTKERLASIIDKLDAMHETEVTR